MLCKPAAAQTDAYLKQLAKQVEDLRVPSANKTARNNAVLALSAAGKPKITLMDDAKPHANEHRARGCSKFLFNKVVTYVHERQNLTMVSRSDYFNSNELGVKYSAIEKSIVKGKTVSYTLTGHSGAQEFVFISFNPRTQFEVRAGKAGAAPIAVRAQGGKACVALGNVSKTDQITFSITSAQTNGEAYDSFVILNHNPQQ